MKPGTDANKQPSDQSTTSPPPNNPNPTTKPPTSPPSDTPLLPHAPSTLSSATDTISSAAASATDTLSSAATSATDTISSAAASATDTLTSAATTAASTVKTAASDALAWTSVSLLCSAARYNMLISDREEKIEKLGAKPEDGRGPYGSAATAPGALSEFDVIAQGVGVSLVGGEANGVKGGEEGEDKKGDGSGK